MEEVESYINVGITKVRNNRIKVLVLAILAGMFIALAGYASVIVSYRINNPSIAKLLSGIIFPIGLILVVLLKTELFTGNSLLVIPLIKKKIKIKEMIINWAIVFFGNLLGSLFVSLLIYYSGALTPSPVLLDAFVTITQKKISYSFINSLILGFLCNVLVCIAVFLATISKNTIEKIFVIFIPISLFIILGFEHSVANMFYLSIGSFLKHFSITSLLFNNLIPVTLGNILGGSAIGLIILYTKSK